MLQDYPVGSRSTLIFREEVPKEDYDTCSKTHQCYRSLEGGRGVSHLVIEKEKSEKKSRRGSGPRQALHHRSPTQLYVLSKS